MDYVPSKPAPHVDDEYIINRIDRAHSGISYIRVENSGTFYAELKGGIYKYRTDTKIYSGTRTLIASRKIFTALIDAYQNFECDNVMYHRNRNTGLWFWDSKR